MPRHTNEDGEWRTIEGPISAGDIVILKSEIPEDDDFDCVHKMIIAHSTAGENGIVVAYFDDNGQLHLDHLPPIAVIKIARQ